MPIVKACAGADRKLSFLAPTMRSAAERAKGLRKTKVSLIKREFTWKNVSVIVWWFKSRNVASDIM